MLKAAAQSAALFVFLLVVLFLGFLLVRTLFPPAQPIEQGKTEQPQQYYAEKDENRKPAESFWQRPTDDPVAFFTLWIAAFTALLVLVSAFQIGFLIRADDTAATSAQAAKESAEAASASVRAYIDSERGRMVVSEIKLIKKDDNDPNPIVDYSFINAGRGVSILIQWSIECELIGSEISRDVTFDSTKAYPANTIVGPGAPIGVKTTPVFLQPCSLRDPLTPDDYANIATEKAFILVKGFIRYKTGFNDIYRRNFAVAYGPHGYFSDVAIPGYNEEYREQNQK